MSKSLYTADGSRSEAGVKEDIKKWLIAHRVYDTKTMKLYTPARGFFWMPVPVGFGISGVTDFLICFQGILVAVETKAGNKPAKPSSDQETFIDNVKRGGGMGFTVNSVEMLVDAWEAVDPNHFLYFPGEKRRCASSMTKEESSTCTKPLTPSLEPPKKEG